MKFSREHKILSGIFLLAFSFRLWFAYQVSFFSSDSAYFHLHHSESIASTFLPIIWDPLSYGGNVILNTHIFHYFLGLLDVILPQSIVYKLIPAFLASSVVLFVYFLAKHVTKNRYAALFAASLAAFVPVFIGSTINQIAIMSVFVPLFLLVIYTLLNLRRRKMWFILLAFLLTMLEPLNLLLLFTLLIFWALLYAQDVSLKRTEKEAIGLFIVLFLLVNLIFYKQLYLDFGLTAVWQNLPLELYGDLFQNFDLFTTISIIGVIPLLLGGLGFLLYQKRDKTFLLLSSVLFATFSLLLLRLIPFEQGVLFLAITLCITSAITIEQGLAYVRLTKLERYSSPILVVLMLVTMVSLVVPSSTIAMEVLHEGVTAEEIEALEWIRDFTPTDSVVAANVYEGNLVIYLAERANIIDTQFFYAEDRIADVETIFTSESLIKATNALGKYDADYLYFSKKSQALYGVEELRYTKGESCFDEVFSNEHATIYHVVC